MGKKKSEDPTHSYITGHSTATTSKIKRMHKKTSRYKKQAVNSAGVNQWSSSDIGGCYNAWFLSGWFFYTPVILLNCETAQKLRNKLWVVLLITILHFENSELLFITEWYGRNHWMAWLLILTFYSGDRFLVTCPELHHAFSRSRNQRQLLANNSLK